MVANCDRFSTLKHPSVLPLAFTEYGTLQAANVLNGDLSFCVNSTTLKATLTLHGHVSGLAVRGEYVYACDDGGLEVVDVSNPEAPQIVFTQTMPDDQFRVTLFADYAFVTSDGSGFVLVDISNPSAPVRLDGANTPGYAWDIEELV